MLTGLIILGAALVGTTILTGWTRRYAIRHRLIDRPNERSSHSIPTSRGGGLAIVITFLLVLLYFALTGELETRAFWAFTGGGLLVAAIGYADDRHDLPALVRLPGHFAAAIWATAWIDGIPSLDLGFATLHWGWLGYGVSVLGIVWLLNLYNFMDGIDGLAASEAVFVAGIAGLWLISDGADALGWSALALAAACVGFLFWNWPQAKIFMGDVGSGFLGYVLGVLAIISARQSDVSLWVWLLLLSVFIVDATITLLRRLMQGKKVYEAHRSHAYQHVTTMLDSHSKVTLGIIGIDVVFLTPLALLAWQIPELAVPITAVTVLPLAVVALRLNAGLEMDQ